jgi:hypothetical protein
MASSWRSFADQINKHLTERNLDCFEDDWIIMEDNIFEPAVFFQASSGNSSSFALTSLKGMAA